MEGMFTCLCKLSQTNKSACRKKIFVDLKKSNDIFNDVLMMY